MAPLRPLALALALVLALPLAGCFGGKDKPHAEHDVETCPMGEVLTGGICVPSQPMNETPPLAKPPLPWFPNDGKSNRTTLEIPSFDDHKIPITIYRPLVADATHQVPVLLHSHGFTGQRTNTDGAFPELVAAGFGVVSFDERGHGDSRDDSEVYFMHPNYEVRDVIAVIDYVATFDWVLMDAPGDPRLGAIGGSYGGAYQLMGAIFDARLDAITPEITWNDITQALAPNGAVKSGWVDLFYVAGNAQGSVVFADDFHAGFAYATASNNFPAGQLPGVPDLYTRLKEASPVSYPGRLTIPTLLIQGMPDTLFPLNQAVANLRLLEAANVTSALYTHLGGHILEVNSLRSGTTPVPVGLQGVPGGKPCGTLVELQIAWHQTYLLGLGNWTGKPRVCLALEDETTVTGETFPLEGTVNKTFDLPGPTPVAQGAVGPRVPLQLLTADADTIVAGIPHLKGTILAAGADSIVYFSLQRLDPASGLEAIIDDQVMPYRLTAPVTSATPFDIDLGGVGTRLKPGDQLVLMVSTVEPMFFGNAERVPGAVVLGDLHLELPTLPTP